MPYQPLIPQPTDRISVSQNDILTNFTELNTQFAIDHIAFDAVSNNGKHNKVSLVDSSSGIPVFVASDVGLYNANDVVGGTGQRQLWYSNPSLGSYPITAGLRSSNGWARIGGGVYLIWGSQTSIANTTTDTTINLAFCPAIGTILQVSVTEFPTSVAGTDNNYVVQLTNTAGPTVGVFQRATATATRVASKRFSFMVTRL
jgi:hypothetical protein